MALATSTPHPRSRQEAGEGTQFVLVVLAIALVLVTGAVLFRLLQPRYVSALEKLLTAATQRKWRGPGEETSPA
jgi:cytochrome b subunit of formate dehydrogenase